MSKVIRVEDDTNSELDKLRVGRQTFNDVLDDILKGRYIVLDAMNMLEGILRYREWQRERQEQQNKS